MFVENLMRLDKKLVEVQVTNKSVIKERLDKINEAYLKELLQSGDIVINRGQKSLIKKVGKNNG